MPHKLNLQSQTHGPTLKKSGFFRRLFHRDNNNNNNHTGTEIITNSNSIPSTTKENIQENSDSVNTKLTDGDNLKGGEEPPPEEQQPEISLTPDITKPSNSAINDQGINNDSSNLDKSTVEQEEEDHNVTIGMEWEKGNTVSVIIIIISC